MNYIVNTETYKGHKIEIWWDEEARYQDYEHFGTFYTNIPRVLNPDGKDIDEAFEDGIFDDGLRFKKELVYVKVYAYIHGIVSLSTSRDGLFADKWDSGWAGIMAVTREKAVEELGKHVTEEEIKNLLEDEVKDLDCFCKGEVYGYTIYKDGEPIHSTGFYVGDIDECLEDAKGMADLYEKAEYERQFKESMNYAEAE